MPRLRGLLDPRPDEEGAHAVGVPREKMVFVSGIGCSSRFPYYMNTYGFHTIHGRAPTFATGLRLANPDLQVWVVTGDGDGLSIGGNHLIHALRRNVDIKMLLFNNEIYGLTKGQYSPTSRLGNGTKTSPPGRSRPRPAAVARPRRRGHVRRPHHRRGRAAPDRDPAEGGRPQGTAFVEIYQNCKIFNDGVFDGAQGPHRGAGPHLVHGEPLRFGPPGDDGLPTRGVVRRPDGHLDVVDVTAANAADLVVHDAHASDPSISSSPSAASTPPR